VIASATFKVAPLPERIDTLVFACASYADACALAGRLRDRPLAPASLVVADGGAAGLPDTRVVLAARFAGIAAAVERQAQAAVAAARAHGASPAELGAAGHERVWRRLAGFADPARGELPGEGIIIRAGAPPAALTDLLGALAGFAPEAGTLAAGEAGVGAAHARWSIGAAEPGRIAAALAQLRAALAQLGGYAVVEAAPGQLGAQLDRWGSPPPTLTLMRGLKAQWDPQGILNRGRYVGGI